jgi:hypothetical protein
MKPGHVVATHADIENLKRDINFEPKTPLAEDILKWVLWYKEFVAGNKLNSFISQSKKLIHLTSTNEIYEHKK